MVAIKTDTGEIEVPLILNDKLITDDMKRWRGTVEEHLGASDSEIVGLAEGQNGEWLAVLRKKR